MTTKYPRLPTGPSPVGGSGVRTLQSAGGDWQFRHNGVNVKSFQQGEFSKVIVSGEPQYIAAGLVSPSKVSIKEVESIDMTARPSTWGAFGISMDGGQFASWQRGNSTEETQVYTYPFPTTGYFSYSARRRNSALTLVFSGIKKSVKAVVDLVVDQEFWPTETPALLIEPPMAYLGDNKVFSVIPQFIGRVDAQARPLIDLLLVVASRKDGASARVLPLPGSDFSAPAEVFPMVFPIVTDDAAFALVIQKRITPAVVSEVGPDSLGGLEDDSSADNLTRAWLYVFPGHDMTINLIQSIGGGGLESEYATISTAFPGGTFLSEAQSALDIAYSGTGRMLDGLLSLVLPGNVILLFHETFHARAWHPSGGPDTAALSAYLHRINITRVTYAAGSVSASQVYQSGLSYPIELSPVVMEHIDFIENNGTGFPRIQSAVYLGNGIVLAKRSSGHAALYGTLHWASVDPENLEKLLEPTDHDVVFMRSTDEGVTWADLAPVGFSNGGKNQHFGDLITHKLATVDAPGSVLISAWDNTALAYCVYESKDNGSSWVRKSKLAKPDGFRRVDSWRPGDGGGHFGELRPVGTKTRPVDVSVPDRYKRGE